MATKVKYSSKEEFEELMKDCPENIIQMVQQDDGSFQIKSPHKSIPLFVVNEVLIQLHKIYDQLAFDKRYKDVPEEHKKYQIYLEKKCRAQKRWTLFWYAVALIAIAYIIIGGR